MANSYFQFQQFRIDQSRAGMKVTTDACLFGAWVANQIHKVEPRRILDIGTGTGLLALMLAQVTKHSIIEAIEVNKEALEEATKNVKNSKWSDRLKVIHSSLQTFKPNKEYDLIICNPPFFADHPKGQNDNKNQAIHSDNLPMKELLLASYRLLRKSGELFVLLPEYEMNEFSELAKQYGLVPNRKISVRNKSADSVFRVMVQFGNASLTESYELNIRDAKGKYTAEFWELLKTYYLEYNDPKLP